MFQISIHQLIQLISTTNLYIHTTSPTKAIISKKQQVTTIHAIPVDQC